MSVIGTVDIPAGSISYVVDPALRRHGYCAAMVGAVPATPELEHIQLFVAGVEPANAGSAGCLRKAGFQPLNTEPDWEGIVYYSRLRRPGYEKDQECPDSHRAEDGRRSAHCSAGPAGSQPGLPLSLAPSRDAIGPGVGHTVADRMRRFGSERPRSPKFLLAHGLQP